MLEKLPAHEICIKADAIQANSSIPCRHVLKGEKQMVGSAQESTIFPI